MYECSKHFSVKIYIIPTYFQFNLFYVFFFQPKALPREGITIFGSQLHTHLRGARVITRHMRGEKELPEINRDDFYSHHFQEIRQLRKKPIVLPVINNIFILN